MAIPKALHSLFADLQNVALATCEGDQPRVRPMTLIRHADSLYLVTGTGEAKTAQLAANPRVEWFLLLSDEHGNGYVRGLGTAEIVQSLACKTELFDAVPFIRAYIPAADHPIFALFRLRMTRYEHMAPGDDNVTRYNEETA